AMSCSEDDPDKLSPSRWMGQAKHLAPLKHLAFMKQLASVKQHAPVKHLAPMKSDLRSSFGKQHTSQEMYA
ncbi:hypothetical protein, partial [Pseudomonas syringae]|uniref:hypothetical protein n=1 Tax=Pseudomonas syringae TaxID=317 RepID=UPI0034D4EF85